MAITLPAVGLLTYETYLTEGEVEGRYDIVEGMREFMPGVSWQHQRVLLNCVDVLRDYEKQQGNGYCLMAPYDVLIRREPRLQTRQPDALYVTISRLAQALRDPNEGVLEIAPELVVEIVSDSETTARLEAKISDYIEIGVDECWVIRPENETVEILRLSQEQRDSLALYAETQTLQSVVFPDLSFPVSTLFAR